MSEKKIIIDINENGTINAETFGMEGIECTETLDRLMKDIANTVSRKKKPEFFKEGTKTSKEINVKNNG